MLSAIRHNKVSHQVFKANEDSLTSTIFEKLNYLPLELLDAIFKQAIPEFPKDADFSTLKSIEYWPHWSADGTSNSNFIEPDVFIRLENYDLIIEAKRYDDNQQYIEQWENEIQGYHNEYRGDDEEQKPKLIFMALGGINDCQLDSEDVILLKCRWTQLLKSIKLVLDKINHTSNLLSTNRSLTKILIDLIDAFALYGFPVADWFENFNYSPKILDSSIDFFINNDYNRSNKNG